MPIRALPWPSKWLINENDMCDQHARCVVLQQKLGRPAETFDYWERSPNRAEKKIETTNRPVLAVALPFQLVCPYHDLLQFMDRTDLDEFKRILNMTDKTKNLAIGGSVHLSVILELCIGLMVNIRPESRGFACLRLERTSLSSRLLYLHWW